MVRCSATARASPTPSAPLPGMPAKHVVDFAGDELLQMFQRTGFSRKQPLHVSKPFEIRYLLARMFHEGRFFNAKTAKRTQRFAKIFKGYGLRVIFRAVSTLLPSPTLLFPVPGTAHRRVIQADGRQDQRYLDEDGSWAYADGYDAYFSVRWLRCG